MTQSIMAGWVWSVTGSGSVRASLSRRAQEVVTGWRKEPGQIGGDHDAQPSVQKSGDHCRGGLRAARQQEHRAGQWEQLPPLSVLQGLVSVRSPGNQGSSASAKGSIDRGGRIAATGWLQGL